MGDIVHLLKNRLGIFHFLTLFCCSLELTCNMSISYVLGSWYVLFYRLNVWYTFCVLEAYSSNVKLRILKVGIFSKIILYTLILTLYSAVFSLHKLGLPLWSSGLSFDFLIIGLQVQTAVRLIWLFFYSFWIQIGLKFYILFFPRLPTQMGTLVSDR